MKRKGLRLAREGRTELPTHGKEAGCTWPDCILQTMNGRIENRGFGLYVGGVVCLTPARARTQELATGANCDNKNKRSYALSRSLVLAQP